MSRWMKIPAGAEYAGVSIRTFRDWLKKGLKHVRLDSGMILTKDIYVDSFLEQFIVQDSTTSSTFVDEMLKDIHFPRERGR